MGGLFGGQRVCWPPLSNYWGGPGPPSSYAYALVFTEDELHEFLDSEELEICYKLGLLTGSIVTTSLLNPPQVSISFYHKLIQELFAALGIISDSDTAFSEFTKTLTNLTAVLEMENVIRFITVFNPCLFNYNKLLFKCILEWDIVHGRKEQKRLYLTNLIIESDCDEKLALCIYHNRKHLKSLKVKVDSSESVNIEQMLFQLTKLTSETPSLQLLDISFRQERCEG